MTFTPIEATVGAVLIQLATTNQLWQNGETIGFSSAISNTFIKSPFNNNNSSSFQIVLGMVLSSVFVRSYLPQFIPNGSLLTITEQDQHILIPLAGLLVGVGTKWSKGCTSGHMIGGLSRLRFRSLVSTALFSTAAMCVVYLRGLGPLVASSKPNYQVVWNTGLIHDPVLIPLVRGSIVLVYLLLPFISSRSPRALQGVLSVVHGVYSGFLFGVGLHVAGMVNPSKTIGFLALPTWQWFDPSLVMIMVFAVLPNIFIWKGIQRPLISPGFKLAQARDIPVKFVLGSVLFGVGWGLLGVCPGPGLLNSVHTPYLGGIWLASFLVGQLVGAY